ncbi:hypothetical protein HYU21_00825 [Candidatus Woesearchaeota archaeon]|nr:hypothetical protein [Candidatus Woesearchaeota archaeon]
MKRDAFIDRRISVTQKGDKPFAQKGKLSPLAPEKQKDEHSYYNLKVESFCFSQRNIIPKIFSKLALRTIKREVENRQHELKATPALDKCG